MNQVCIFVTNCKVLANCCENLYGKAYRCDQAKLFHFRGNSLLKVSVGDKLMTIFFRELLVLSKYMIEL